MTDVSRHPGHPGHRALRRLAAAGLAAALLAAGSWPCPAAGLPAAGLPAADERELLVFAFVVMLALAAPVIALIALFATFYRASNDRAAFREMPAHASLLEIATWIVPALLVAVLGTVLWRSTHRLDPYRPIDPQVPPTVVQVIAQDWKWLFLYPEQGIASVNELAFPAGRPLSLRITSDVAMNSFMIPALGGQIYAMAGMETRMNLRAGARGRFVGRNMQYTGRGFPEQRFAALALSDGDFDRWVAKARAAAGSLDAAAYAELARPGVDHPVAYYSGFEPGLFAAIIARQGPDAARSPSPEDSR